MSTCVPTVRTVSIVAVASGLSLMPATARADGVDACFNAAERAQALHRESKLRQAHQELETCTRNACPRSLRDDCNAWLREVEVEFATLVVHPVDATGHDLDHPRIQIDGQVVDPDKDPVNLDPGEHIVRVEQAGSAPSETRISLRRGEHAQAPVTLTPLQARPVDSSKTSVDPLPPLGYSREQRSHSIPTGAWILGGVGVASLGATAALWLAGMSERSSLMAGCGSTHSCAESDIDASRTKLVIGDITGAIGLVALGAATWLTLASWDTRPATRIRVDTVRGGGVGVVEGRF